MGSRAEERVEHVVFSVRPACLPLVHAPAWAPSIRRSGFLLCACAAQQTSGNRASISAPSVGLLAAWPDWRSGCARPGGARRERAWIIERMAGIGKAATPAALRSQRRSNDEGAGGRTRCPDFF